MVFESVSSKRHIRLLRDKHYIQRVFVYCAKIHIEWRKFKGGKSYLVIFDQDLDWWQSNIYLIDDDDCFYYHSWRNNALIAFETFVFVYIKSWSRCKTWVGPGVCHQWGHNRYPDVRPGWHQPNFGRQPWLRDKGGEGCSNAATRRLPGRRGVVDVEIGPRQPRSPIGETTSSNIGCWDTRGGTHSRMRGLKYGPHDQGAKITTHFRQFGNQWDVQAPSGKMGEAGANRPQSVIGTRRV